MKVRSDFVTNSSSSSFIVCKSFLTQEQIELIYKHENALLDYHCGDSDKWEIRDDGDAIVGFTWMDNFPMWNYLSNIGVDLNHVVFKDY